MMRGKPKPGVNWDWIRDKVENGTTKAQAARDHKEEFGIDVTPQAITKRSNKEGWQKTKNYWLKQTENLPRYSTEDNRSLLYKKTPENLAQVLDFINKGMTFQRAAELAGLSDDTINRWKKEDAEFAALITQAQRQFEHDRLENIQKAEERGDWKASAYMLERNPATKEIYAQSQGNTGGIQVTVNVHRAEGDPVIDITPGDSDEA